MVESDGKESVGTSQVGIVAEPEKQLIISEEKESLAEPCMEADYDADSESILPLFEDRLGYGIEEEYVQSPTCPRHVGVYVNSTDNAGGNQFDPNLLTKEITADNAAARAEELLAAREALEKQLADVAEANRKLVAYQALVQTEQARIQAEQTRIRTEQERVQAEAAAVRNRNRNSPRFRIGGLGVDFMKESISIQPTCFRHQ